MRIFLDLAIRENKPAMQAFKLAAGAARFLAQRLSHAQAMPNTITPATTATAIAQTLTLTSPTTCRLASFSAISRLRCLSWSGEPIANLRIARCDLSVTQFAEAS